MYATGSATTVDALINAMSAFAQANCGMTESVRRHEELPSTVYDYANSRYFTIPTTVICLTKGTSNWWFAFSDNSCEGYIANSNGGSVWKDLMVAPYTDAPNVSSRCNILAQPFVSYHFFTEGTVLHMAAEMASGAWAHMNFGDITKYGSWSGGGHFMLITSTMNYYYGYADPNFLYSTFLTGNPNSNGAGGVDQYSVICVPFLGKQWGLFGWSSDTYSMGQNSPTNLAVMGLGHVKGVSDAIIRDAPNLFNNRASAVRMEVFVGDSSINGGSSNLWLPIGYIPNIRAINIALLNPKDIVNTDWMVFPCQSKLLGPQSNGPGSFACTYNLGWAVRK